MFLTTNPFGNQITHLHQDFSFGEGLNSFASTNALLQYSAQFKQSIIHFWRLADTLILGMQDTRLPEFTLARQELPTPFGSFVRNSGGLAVVADLNVLNVSLFIPDTDLTISQGYQIMASLIRATFANPTHQIDIKEIKRSYCPGDYDLSIDGQKFAGISQRRIKDGIVVMLYLSVTGNQQFRSELVKTFYQHGMGTQAWDDRFPQVDPTVMANLDTLLGVTLTPAQVENQLLVTLKNQHNTINQQAITKEPEFQLYYQHALTDMTRRNQKKE